MVPAEGAGAKFIFGKIEPGLAYRLASSEQHRRHVVAVEDDGLPLAVLIRQLDASQRREGGHEVQAADDVIVLCVRIDLRAPGDSGDAIAALAQGALGAAERRVAGVR